MTMAECDGTEECAIFLDGDFDLSDFTIKMCQHKCAHTYIPDEFNWDQELSIK